MEFEVKKFKEKKIGFKKKLQLEKRKSKQMEEWANSLKNSFNRKNTLILQQVLQKEKKIKKLTKNIKNMKKIKAP